MEDSNSQQNVNQESSRSDGNASRSDVCRWFELHGDALYRFASKRVQEPADCEDLLQETFIAAWRAREKFQGKSQVRTWLIAILRLKIIDNYRRRSHHKLSRSLDGEAMQDSLATSWGSQPENALELNEFQGVYQQCLEHLPATLARAFLLREMDDCSPQQVCELLNISESNLSVRLHRARQQLRHCLTINWFSKD